MLPDLVLQKNYFQLLPTVLNFLNNLPNFTYVNTLQSEITEALPNTVKASTCKKQVLAKSIAICIAIHQYSQNAPCILNSNENIYPKTLSLQRDLVHCTEIFLILLQ